jgi:uncharacterized phage-associated protein
MDIKKDAFKYVMFKLIDWYRSENNITEDEFNEDNDFDTLKVLKLLYFTTAVNAKNNSLLNTFDNFYAMPFGHVESNIYDELKYKRDLGGIEINRKTIIKNSFKDSIDEFRFQYGDIATEIDKAVDLLGEYNGEDFLEYDSFEYVEMSHALKSWKVFYNKAKSVGDRSAYIDHSYIRRDGQCFLLEDIS